MLVNHWTLTVGSNDSNLCALCSSTPHEQRLFQAKAQTSLAGFQDQVPHVSSCFIMFHHVSRSQLSGPPTFLQKVFYMALLSRKGNLVDQCGYQPGLCEVAPHLGTQHCPSSWNWDFRVHWDINPNETYRRMDPKIHQNTAMLLSSEHGNAVVQEDLQQHQVTVLKPAVAVIVASCGSSALGAEMPLPLI